MDQLNIRFSEHIDTQTDGRACVSWVIKVIIVSLVNLKSVSICDSWSGQMNNMKKNANIHSQCCTLVTLRFRRVIWGRNSNLVFNPGPRVCPFSFQFPEPLILLNIIFAHCWNCRSAVYLQLFLLYLLDNLSSTLLILTHWLDWFPPRIVQLHLLTAQLSVLLCLLLVTGCGGWPAASQ